jgi:glycosyltransferase involved in cell wall biosynthesis
VFGGYLPVIAGPVFSKWLKVPLISLLRGNDFDHALFTPRRRQILLDCLEASEAIGCVSREMINKLKSIKPELKLLYTPNGIRLDDWKLMKSEEDFGVTWINKYAAGKNVIALFGHLKEKKGLKVLLEAFRSSEKLRKNSLLLLVGELENSAQMELSELQVPYHVLPFLDRYELLRYYGIADLIVIPSYYDGMPNVLLEAGALGVPVAGSDTGGIHDVLYPECKDMLFIPGKSEDLRNLLIKFFEQPIEYRKSIGLRLKELIKIHYNHLKEIEHISNLILSSYETKFII